MANLGEDPELESRLFCESCRRRDHGKVLTYDAPEVRRQLESKELKLGNQCKHCGLPKSEPKSLSELKQEAFEGTVAQSFPEQPVPQRRTRAVAANG